MDTRMIDVAELHTKLKADGLPVIGVSSDGRVDYSRALTAAEQTTARQAIAAHDPTKYEREETAARDQARVAVADLRLYLDRVNPTNAQTVATLKTVIRVVLWLLRNEFKG